MDERLYLKLLRQLGKMTGRLSKTNVGKEIADIGKQITESEGVLGANVFKDILYPYKEIYERKGLIKGIPQQLYKGVPQSAGITTGKLLGAFFRHPFLTSVPTAYLIYRYPRFFANLVSLPIKGAISVGKLPFKAYHTYRELTE